MPFTDADELTGDTGEHFVTSDPVDDDVVARMGMAWREMRRGAATAVVRDRMFGSGADGIEPGHMDVLDLLVRESPWRMSDLAGALHVDPSTITRTIQRMELDGLAVRSPASQDRRVVMVEITAEGRRRHRVVAERRAEIIQRVMARMAPDERWRLVELLEQFLAALDHYVRAELDPAAGNGH